MQIKNEAVFFCSAFNDISYILAEINYKKYDTILIFIVNNSGAFQFFDSLKIKGVKLKFIKTRLNNNLNPIHWIKEFTYVHFYLYFLFRKITKLPVYFYTTFYDKICMYAAFQLKNNNFLYLGYYPEPSEFICRKRRLYDSIISLLYFAPIHSFTSSYFNVSGLSDKFVKKYFLKERDVHISERNYIQNKYSVKFSDKKPFILILSSKEDDGIIKVHSSTKKIFLYILHQFKTEDFFLKAHPRIGPATFLSHYNINVIPSFVPIEFIDFTNCKLVIGLNSIALSNIASKGIRVLSLINLIDFSSEHIRQNFIHYLNTNCTNYKIDYPNSFNSLKIYLNQIKNEF